MKKRLDMLMMERALAPSARKQRHSSWQAMYMLMVRKKIRRNHVPGDCKD